MLLRSCPVAALLLATLVSGGCVMLGPDYETPPAPVETQWLEYEDPSLETTPPVLPEWWSHAFGDPVLDQLVQTALTDNLTLRSAGLRVLQARQQLLIAIGNQYPQQQSASGSAETGRSNRRTDEVYDLGFGISWEADVWGRFRRQVESASAQLDASLASYDGVLVSLVASVAQNYLLLRTTEARLAVARRNVELQDESVRITEAKLNAGATSALDVEQAKTLLYSTRLTVPPLEASVQQFRNSLAVLLGRPPAGLPETLLDSRPIPEVDAELAVGMPQDLVRRRPDIRVAERQLAAQSAQIGVAITDLYPQFTLGGSIGTTAETILGQDTGDLFSSDTSRWGLSAGFDWKLFNYGRLRNNVRFQDAIFQQLLEDYRQTVLQAQAEVENAIVAYLRSVQQLAESRRAASAAASAAELSRIQYEDGLITYNTVITTLQALATQQDQLASTAGTVTTNLVEVYRSLGGGWEIRPSSDPVDLLPEATRDEMRERTRYWDRVLPE